MRVSIALTVCVIRKLADAAQVPDPGRVVYASRCAGCHGTDGDGGELGPSITMRVPARTDEDLKTLFREGLPMAGMPAFPALTDAEVRDLTPLFAHPSAARGLRTRPDQDRAHVPALRSRG